MRELLARPPGWLPPPEVGVAAAVPQAEQWSVASGGTAATVALQDAALVPLPVAAVGVDAARVPLEGAVAAFEPDAADVHVPAGPAPGRPAEPLPVRLRLSALLPVALLPVALRTGRVDPGRRGAVALVLACLLAALVAGVVLLRARPSEVLVPQVLARGAPLPGATPNPDPGTEVVVSVAGRVARPGVVRLPVGSRVDDAVRAAGGAVPGATTGLLNLARRLVDGEQVLVGITPAAGQDGVGRGGAGQGAGGGGAGPAPGAAAPGGLLDLNTATVSDLDALPGLGPVLAQRILDWRTEHQRFASVDQLREVTGIGEAKYDDIKGEVTV